MHEFILKIFGFIKSSVQFIKIALVFVILLLLSYWIQNLTGGEWSWMAFFKPLFNDLLKFSDSIYSASYDFYGAVFELKYFTSVVILIILCLITNVLGSFVIKAEEVYKKARNACIKTHEEMVNLAMQKQIEMQEKAIFKYSMCIKTKVQDKFIKQKINVDIEEESRLMNLFIKDQLGLRTDDIKTKRVYDTYFSLIEFTDFNKIDDTLDILFRILKSNSKIEYAICIQAGDNQAQLTKIVALNYYGKIAMAADTKYRYDFNDVRKYTTSMIGVFQHENNTIEIYEFKENL